MNAFYASCVSFQGADAASAAVDKNFSKDDQKKLENAERKRKGAVFEVEVDHVRR